MWFKFRTFINLVALPPSVFFARMSKRVLGSKGSMTNLNPSQSTPFQNHLKGIELGVSDSEIAEFLIRRYTANEVDYLGTGWVNWKREDGIAWQWDPVAGFEWDANASSSSQLALSLYVQDADIKRPWELARFQHFLRWIEACHSTGSNLDVVGERFHEWVEDFISKNPQGQGVHWVNAMEVSIRAINWMVIADLLSAEDIDLHPKLHSEIRNHINFVYNHLERKEGLGNNHYLANLIGLLFGRIYYPDWKELQNLESEIISEFDAEAQKQFKTDGGNFEGSIYYHKLSTEILILGTACVSHLRSAEHLKPLHNTTQKAIEFLQGVIKPNLELPDFGDNDGGSILNFFPQGHWKKASEASESYDGWRVPDEEENVFIENTKDASAVIRLAEGLSGKRYLLEGSLVNAINQIALDGKGYTPIQKIERGLPAKGKYQSDWVIPFEEIDLSAVERSYYPQTGLIVYKSEEFYLAMSMLERKGSHRYRGHFHNDELSIVLWVKGKSIVSDPGTVTYTGDMDLRNFLRSSRAHNGPYFGVESNPYLKGLIGLFHQWARSKSRLVTFEPTMVKAKVKFGKFYGSRSIKLEPNKVVITDFGNKPFTVNKGEGGIQADGYGRILKA